MKKVTSSFIGCTLLALALVLIVFNRSSHSEQANYEAADKQTVMLLNPNGTMSGGTGFVVKAPSGERFTMTNKHICEMAKGGDHILATRTGRGQVQRLYIRGISSTADLCVLTPFPGMEGLAVASEVRLHDIIFVVGHPLLRPTTVSRGYILGRDSISLFRDDVPNEECAGGRLRRIRINTIFGGEIEVCMEDFDALLTDARTFPGNSGSPVVNESGAVIGVLFAGDQAGNGYLVPLSEVVLLLANF